MITIRPGMRIRHISDSISSAGTIGAFARRSDRTDDKIYLISCSHVLAPFGRPKGGSNSVVTGAGNKKVGTLIAHTLDKEGDGYTYSVDAALAVIDRKKVDVNRRIKKVGPITGTGRFRAVSMKVYLKGHDDDWLRQATITEIVPPDAWKTFSANGKKYRLYGAVKVEAEEDGKFGDRGDSGAIVLNRFGCAVGMTTFKIKKTNRRYFAPIELVLRDLEHAAGYQRDTLELVTEPGPADLEQIYEGGPA